MPRRDLSITIALCVSLLVHGLGMLALTEYEIRSQARSLHRPAFNLRQWLSQHPDAARSASIAAPAIARSPPEPKLPPLPEFDELFGERGAKGKALNSSLGEQLMQAQQAPQEQAALTPTPGAANSSPGERGSDGIIADAQTQAKATHESPAMTLLPFGPPVDPAAPFGMPPAPAPPPLPPRAFQAESQVIGIPVASAVPSPIKSTVTQDGSPATRPMEIASTTRPSQTAMAAPTTSPITDEATTRPVRDSLNESRNPSLAIGQMPATTQPTLVKVATTRPAEYAVSLALSTTPRAMDASENPAPAPPGPAAPSHSGGGDAGNKSESESDPFSKTPTLTYRNGKLEARDGRKVKTVRPKLTDAGIQAVIAMEEPLVILAVKIDEQGKVTGVDYVRKSGSNEVDLPTYLAAWKWEFEPSKDKNGNPKPDAFVIPFVWR